MAIENSLHKRVACMLLACAAVGACLAYANTPKTQTERFMVSRATAEALWGEEDWETAAREFAENLAEVVYEANEMGLTQNWRATSVEYSAPVYLECEKENAAYVDFNGNTGFVVVTKTYYIYALYERGDLDMLRGCELIGFDSIDQSFTYYDKKGNVQYYACNRADRGDPGNVKPEYFL